MSLPTIYIQLCEEGRIIELRIESFDMADAFAAKIKEMAVRVLSEECWTPEPIPTHEHTVRYPIREEAAAEAQEVATFRDVHGGFAACTTLGCPRPSTHFYNRKPYCRYHGRGSKKGGQP